MLFQEFIPHSLHDWLAAQLAAGRDAAVAACAMVGSRLPAGVAFMNGHGLTHFDAPFGNVLTDGRRLDIADFGLAASPRFDLSARESGFLARKATHDTGYALMQLVNWLVTNICGWRCHERAGPCGATRTSARARPVRTPSVLRRPSPRRSAGTHLSRQS
ncbi:hypothetical protein [Nonomuraea sp. NPDC049129]|uniref:hypothetical protein n=1 Tax=Nonomuraea sp. NPDC049129 TaxID=3155272 RepID=UPI0033C7D6D0